MKKFAFVFLFFLKIGFSAEVKVLIDRSKNRFMIRGADLKLELQNQGKNYFLKKRIGRIRCKKIKANEKIKISSPSGFVRYGKDIYRGQIEVVKTSSGTCQIIWVADLEKYLISVVSREMGRNWPIEALKAQAVAARSYAYRKIVDYKNKNYHLENSQKNQVSGDLDDESYASIKAVKETKNLILKNNRNHPVLAFFHSKCGGLTLTPKQVWGRKVAGYVSHACPYCHDYGKKNWVLELSREMMSKIKSKLGNLHKKVSSIPKKLFRNILGVQKVPSNNFEVLNKNSKIMLRGKGMGHGVGLCQYGARKMAELGRNYKEILHFYYPNFHVEEIYESLPDHFFSFKY